MEVSVTLLYLFLYFHFHPQYIFILYVIIIFWFSYLYFVIFLLHISIQQPFPHPTFSYQCSALHPPLTGPPTYCLPFTHSYVRTIPTPIYSLLSWFLHILIPFTFSHGIPVHTTQNIPHRALSLVHPAPPYMHLYLHADYSSALMMEAPEPTTASVLFHQPIWCYILNKVVVIVQPW